MRLRCAVRRAHNERTMDVIDPGLRRIQRRQRVWAVIHHGRGRLGRTFNIALSFLIVLSASLIPLEWFDALTRYRDIVHIVEAVIVSLFTLEYLVRIYAAPRRLKYVLSLPGFIDLLSIAPFYAGVFGVEFIRVLRLVRFLKLIGVEASAHSDQGRSLRRGIGMLPDERVEHVVTKHPLVLLLGCLPPVIAMTSAFGMLLLLEQNVIALSISLTLVLFALVFFWRAWLDYSYDVIYVTNRRLIFQNQHLLGRSINQVGYASITNVKPQYAGIFSYLFRFGTLIIDTAAEHPGQIGMHMVRHHEKAAHAIMGQCAAHGQGVANYSS